MHARSRHPLSCCFSTSRVSSSLERQCDRLTFIPPLAPGVGAWDTPSTQALSDQPRARTTVHISLVPS